MPVKKTDQSQQNLPGISDLKACSTASLKELFVRLHGAPLPAYARRSFLIDNIAWMLQVIESGEDPKRTRTELVKLANNFSIHKGPRYLPGTRLIREWHGTTHEVEIEESGYRWKNRRYRSLTQIAQEITGAHWSGPRFFGLTKLPTSQVKGTEA